MARHSTGARFNLGQPWDGELADFCEAHFGASATKVVREALRIFIEAELSRDAATRQRYEELRKKRNGATAVGLRLVPPAK